MPNEQSREESREELIAAARAILRPLVRLLIAHGLPFPAFARIGKQVYVEVAATDFSLPFKKQTDSRIALVTGITRKEVGSLRRRGVQEKSPTAHLDYGLATRVISRWVTESRYRDDRGEPLALLYEAPPGSPSFVSLVAEVGGDIPPRAVADELIRVGTVELTPDGRVRLLQRAYVPAAGTPEKIAILGADASELIAAIAHNIESPDEEAFLQRKVHYDNIGSDGISDVRRHVRTAGGSFLEQLSAHLARYDRDRNPAAPGGRRKRVVVGLYYFDEDYEDGGDNPLAAAAR